MFDQVIRLLGEVSIANEYCQSIDKTEVVQIASHVAMKVEVTEFAEATEHMAIHEQGTGLFVVGID